MARIFDSVSQARKIQAFLAATAVDGLLHDGALHLKTRVQYDKE